MVDLLVKLLGPTLYNLGVSEADLISYLTQLEGYIYSRPQRGYSWHFLLLS